MTTGLLIVIYFLTIPFLCEAEELSKNRSKYLRFADFLKLKHFFSQRWSIGYFILLFLIFAIAFAPSKAGVRHEASWSLIGSVILIQAIFWGSVIYKFMQKKDLNNGN